MANKVPTPVLFLGLLGGFGLIAFAGLAKAHNKKVRSGDWGDTRPKRVHNGLTLARPKVNSKGLVHTERDKRYLLKGTVPASMSEQEFVERFESNHLLESLDYARNPENNERGFQLIYTSPANWLWEIPGEMSTLRFPNRIVSVEEIIE